MDAMVKHLSQKRAARALGVEPSTIESQCYCAAKKIGATGHLGRYLMWDRWRRGVDHAA
jgi:predicted DNA-binding protein (UPF0251 family)